jgi:hypothetical protein
MPEHITLLGQTARKAIDQSNTKWLRVSDAAVHLGVGVGTLNKLRTYGGGPRYAKLGSTVIYDVEDLNSWAEARKVHSTSEVVRAA